MNVGLRNNVVLSGKDDRPVMLFAHGFGCDQNMWRFVAPAFAEDFQTLLFDHVGAGKSDLSAYSKEKYRDLQGYADDIIEIGKEYGLEDAVFVGHSVSAMIGVMAAAKVPGMFKSLVLVAPSPCYLNDEDYHGGFTRDEIGELLDSLDSNHFGWSMTMAPMIMGNPDREELGAELAKSFCRTDPEIAKDFARTTFLSDCRGILGNTDIPSLILQCSDDIIAPISVGEYLHARMKNSTLVVMNATGHCPNLSAPDETIAAMKSFL